MEVSVLNSNGSHLQDTSIIMLVGWFVLSPTKQLRSYGEGHMETGYPFKISSERLEKPVYVMHLFIQILQRENRMLWAAHEGTERKKRQYTRKEH